MSEVSPQPVVKDVQFRCWFSGKSSGSGGETLPHTVPHPPPSAGVRQGWVWLELQECSRVCFKLSPRLWIRFSHTHNHPYSLRLWHQVNMKWLWGRCCSSAGFCETGQTAWISSAVESIRLRSETILTLTQS